MVYTSESAHLNRELVNAIDRLTLAVEEQTRWLGMTENQRLMERAREMYEAEELEGSRQNLEQA